MELLKSEYSDVIAPFTKKTFTKVELEKSEYTKAPSSLIEIEENLRRKVYSNAEQFREEMLKLEHVVMQTNYTGESTNTARIHFRQNFETKWSQMNSWLRINEASWSNEDPKPAEYTASSAIQPDVAQEQAAPQSKSLYTTIDQFNFLAALGQENSAKVMLAESKSNQQLYVIKIFKKEFMIENDEAKGTKTERNVFLKAREHNHPFIAPLISTFQTETRLYFVMKYCPGGDLMHHIHEAAFGVTRSK